MQLPDFTTTEWCLVAIAAFSSGVGKSGLAGFGMLGVVLMAIVVPGRASTGIVLPLLVAADIVAASTFRQHIDWPLIRRLGMPIVAGVVAGWGLLQVIPDAKFRPILGAIILVLVITHWLRQWKAGGATSLPNNAAFAWFIGPLVGITTMLANAAGPIATVYFLSLGLGKDQFVHTMAWLFLFVNLFKVPFMVHLNMINWGSLSLNAVLIPALICGMAAGVWAVKRLPRKTFEFCVLLLALGSAIKLLLP